MAHSRSASWLGALALLIVQDVTQYQLGGDAITLPMDAKGWRLRVPPPIAFSAADERSKAPGCRTLAQPGGSVLTCR